MSDSERTPEEVRKRLYIAAEWHMPSLEGMGSGEKIGALEDFSIGAAQFRGQMEEDRLYIDHATHNLVVEWEALVGWEGSLPGGKRRRDATKDDITQAKRLIRPDLYSGISDGRHLTSQLSAQIRRLEKDEDRASRIYTFLTGQ